MIYADTSELVALMILHPHHVCSDSCLCHELRTLPQVEEAIQKLRAMPSCELEESCWT